MTTVPAFIDTYLSANPHMADTAHALDLTKAQLDNDCDDPTVDLSYYKQRKANYDAACKAFGQRCYKTAHTHIEHFWNPNRPGFWIQIRQVVEEVTIRDVYVNAPTKEEAILKAEAMIPLSSDDDDDDDHTTILRTLKGATFE